MSKFTLASVDNREEITIALIGNVDSGKSTTIGVLTKGQLDDGKGHARHSIMTHQHEQQTGRTSSVSYNYTLDEKRVYTFIDLCGHESYLRTTINGLSSGYADLAIVCISDKITKMTKEHIALAHTLNIPMLILMTKVDFIPKEKTKNLVQKLKRIFSSVKKKMFAVKKLSDMDFIHQSDVLIPYLMISNKSGYNVELLKQITQTYPLKQQTYINGFCIEHVWYVHGQGIVVSGLVGQEITNDSVLNLGPFDDGKFIPVRAKSLHNDYRTTVDKLSVGQRGCICLKFSKSDKNKFKIRVGQIIAKDIPMVCREFIAQVKIFHHSTSIKKGYQAYVNCGLVKETVVFEEIYSENVARSGHDVKVRMRFLKYINYIEPGQKIIFREGTTRGIGVVKEVIACQ